MGRAIAFGALNSGVILPNELAVCDLNTEKFSDLPEGVCVVTDVEELPQCEYVLFAVKPQGFSAVAKKYKPNGTVVSIMAGVKIDTIIASINAKSVCRVMPNTPCMVGKGMCALCFDNCTEKDERFLISLFSALGKAVVVTEDELDAVTAVSGSGPAYVYYFVKSMVDAGVKLGLSEENAKELALQTFDGAVEMVRTTGKPLSELIDNVCSPGGTTIQAINCFDENNLSKIVSKAMERCARRSAELSEGK